MASSKKEFDPSLSVSTATDAALSAFVDAPLVEDLKSVPGIGDAIVGHLAAANVTSTHQLIGTFLGLRSLGISRKDHMQRFFEFLMDVGKVRTANLAAAIVVAIAAKCSGWIPGLYNPEDYDAPAGGAGKGGAKK